MTAVVKTHVFSLVIFLIFLLVLNNINAPVSALGRSGNLLFRFSYQAGAVPSLRLFSKKSFVRGSSHPEETRIENLRLGV